MIRLMSRDTCKTCYIPEEFITKMEELEEETEARVYPYTRLTIEDTKNKYFYTIDVVESVWKIKKVIQEANEEKSKPKEQIEE